MDEGPGSGIRALRRFDDDACRTDLFARTNRESGGRSLLRSLESVAHASNGLAPTRDAPPGTKVLYATASKEAAY
ncbi:MAG TPA: hypothetical protein VEW04_09770, partial [Allosphingosinicella sp.]|nr:hypothetical protein [Allosphingosinicella sp.]